MQNCPFIYDNVFSFLDLDDIKNLVNVNKSSRKAFQETCNTRLHIEALVSPISFLKYLIKSWNVDFSILPKYFINKMINISIERNIIDLFNKIIATDLVSFEETLESIYYHQNCKLFDLLPEQYKSECFVNYKTLKLIINNNDKKFFKKISDNVSPDYFLCVIKSDLIDDIDIINIVLTKKSSDLLLIDILLIISKYNYNDIILSYLKKYKFGRSLLNRLLNCSYQYNNSELMNVLITEYKIKPTIKKNKYIFDYIETNNTQFLSILLKSPSVSIEKCINYMIKNKISNQCCDLICEKAFLEKTKHAQLLWKLMISNNKLGQVLQLQATETIIYPGDSTIEDMLISVIDQKYSLVAEYLLNKYSEKTFNLKEIFLQACIDGLANVISILLKQNKIQGSSSFIIAAIENYHYNVLLMLSKNNKFVLDKSTIVESAIQSNNLEAVDFLISHKVNFNEAYKYIDCDTTKEIIKSIFNNIKGKRRRVTFIYRLEKIKNCWDIIDDSIKNNMIPFSDKEIARKYGIMAAKYGYFNSVKYIIDQMNKNSVDSNFIIETVKNMIYKNTSLEIFDYLFDLIIKSKDFLNCNKVNDDFLEKFLKTDNFERIFQNIELGDSNLVVTDLYFYICKKYTKNKSEYLYSSRIVFIITYHLKQFLSHKNIIDIIESLLSYRNDCYETIEFLIYETSFSNKEFESFIKHSYKSKFHSRKTFKMIARNIPVTLKIDFLIKRAILHGEAYILETLLDKKLITQENINEQLPRLTPFQEKELIYNINNFGEIKYLIPKTFYQNKNENK